MKEKTSENRLPSEIHIRQLRLYTAAAEPLGLEPVSRAMHDLEADEGHQSPPRFRRRQP